MRILTLISLLVFTFGAISFGELFFLCLRTWRLSKPDAAAIFSGLFTAFCSLWFILNVVIVLVDLSLSSAFDSLYLVMMAFGLAFPPLIMQDSYFQHRSFLAKRSRWKLTLLFTAVISAVSFAGLMANGLEPRTVVAALTVLCG